MASRVEADSFLMLLNAHAEAIEFILPERKFGEVCEAIIDTNDPGMQEGSLQYKAGDEVPVVDRSVVVLRGLDGLNRRGRGFARGAHFALAQGGLEAPHPGAEPDHHHEGDDGMPDGRQLQVLQPAGVERIAATQTLGQMSEAVFMVLMPLFFARLGVKWMLLVGMAAWVARYGAVENPVVYDVFDGRGARVARYRLPAGQRIIGITERAIYAVRTDELGLFWLEVYQVP